MARRYGLGGGGQCLGMSKKAFFKSIDPGIFNWGATETKKADDDASEIAREEEERWLLRGGLKPLR